MVKRYYESLTNSELRSAEVIVWLKQEFEVPSPLVEPLARFLAKAQRSKDTNKVQSAMSVLIKHLGTQTSKLE
ncbi:hypothetical protein B1M_30135 [Burkholderia sp. TJI49]|nr:hypothetical protein B1M_30135 [Burkholderia sp. TJI49]